MNPKFILTLVDTMQIQSYIFASSKLKEIVGASELVRKTTQKWLVKAIYHHCGAADKIKNEIDLHLVLTEQPKIEDGSQFEIIYCGGGNAKILFRDKADAYKVIKVWSRKVLKDAPGLKIAVIHHEFEWKEDEAFSKVIDDAEQKLARKKSQFSDHVGNLATPFVVRCSSSGLPAYGHDKQGDNNRLSTQALKKRGAAQKSLAEMWGLIDETKHAFPLDLDELGMKEGSNYIGIIHADGNRMGEKVKKVAQNAPPRRYITAIRKFSTDLAVVSKNTFKGLLGWINENHSEWTVPRTGILGIKFVPVKDNGNTSQDEHRKIYLPIRPIIIGGDDFTAVVPGKIALAASEFYQKAFNKESRKFKTSFGKDGLAASSGVAIVHSHHPFDKAYELAESLAASAKNAHAESEENQAWLDWYIATDSDVAEVSLLRQKKYQYAIEDQTVALTMKPYRVDSISGNKPNFEQFQKDVCSLCDKEKFPRNKLKQLLDVCTEGPDEAQAMWQTLSASLSVSQKTKLERIFKCYHGNGGTNSNILFRTPEKEDSNMINKETAIVDLIESLEFVLNGKGGDK